MHAHARTRMGPRADKLDAPYTRARTNSRTNPRTLTQVVELKCSLVWHTLRKDDNFAAIFWFLMCKVLDAGYLEVYISIAFVFDAPLPQVPGLFAAASLLGWIYARR